MDALTRERFAPGPRRPVITDEIRARRAVLLGLDDTALLAEEAQSVRVRPAALIRSRRLARAIRTYQVRALW